MKLLHNAIWAIMATSFVAVPWARWFAMFRLAFGLTLLVLAKGLVLAINGGRCRLTDFAARYPDERPDNFAIYLPMWHARYHKSIFGFLFQAGELVLLWQWARRPMP